MHAVSDTPDVMTLRQVLRDATSAEHERLDGAVTMLDFSRPGDYRRFLSFQLMARKPVEDWLEAQVLSFALPPRQSGLIADDLEELGGPLWAGSAPFTPPAGADPIGACWALAGSSLGNRAMHRTLTRIASQERLPDRFLADGAMTQYWNWLKPRIEVPGREGPDAIACARAVFAAFTAATEDCLGPNLRVLVQ